MIKKSLIVVVAVIAATVATPRSSQAKSVVCIAGYGCIHSERSCAHRFGPNYEVELKNSFAACVNYLVGKKPTGSVALRRNAGKPAVIVIDGKESRLASGELDAFLDRSLKDERIWKKDKFDAKVSQKFLIALKTFVAKDPGISEDGLAALSRQLKVPVAKAAVRH